MKTNCINCIVCICVSLLKPGKIKETRKATHFYDFSTVKIIK